MTVRRALAALCLLAEAGALVVGPPHGARPAPGTGPGPVVVEGRAPAPAAAPAPSAEAVSRTFLAAYLGFIYARLSAAELPDASPYVRRQAAGQRPHPPAAVLAAADPRLTNLRLTRQGPSATRAVARIADGALAYQIALTLHRRSTGWTITGLSETS